MVGDPIKFREKKKAKENLEKQEGRIKREKKKICKCG